VCIYTNNITFTESVYPELSMKVTVIVIVPLGCPKYVSTRGIEKTSDILKRAPAKINCT